MNRNLYSMEHDFCLFSSVAKKKPSERKLKAYASFFSSAGASLETKR